MLVRRAGINQPRLRYFRSRKGRMHAEHADGALARPRGRRPADGGAAAICVFRVHPPSSALEPLLWLGKHEADAKAQTGDGRSAATAERRVPHFLREVLDRPRGTGPARQFPRGWFPEARIDRSALRRRPIANASRIGWCSAPALQCTQSFTEGKAIARQAGDLAPCPDRPRGSCRRHSVKPCLHCRNCCVGRGPCWLTTLPVPPGRN